MTTTSIQNNEIRRHYWPIALIGLTMLVLALDLMHSIVWNYSFYLSESLLFGMFWLIFIPFILTVRKKGRENTSLLLPLVLSLFHIGLFSLLVFLISALFFEHTFGFFPVLIDTISENGLVCLSIYGVYGFLLSRKQKVFEEVLEPKISGKVKVLHQNRALILDCRDIVYVKSEKPYIALVTQERKYLYNSTLKKFLEEKPTGNFIRIHKSTLVNTNCFVSFTSRKNGDYDVQLANGDEVRASRSFNQNFKPFFD